MKTLARTFLSASIIALTACGGGDDNAENLTTEQVLSLARNTNSANQNYPDSATNELLMKTPEAVTYYLGDGVLRWSTETQIPLYFVSIDGANPPQTLIDGVAQLESRLGDIFTDFKILTWDVQQYRDTNASDENMGNGTFDKAFFMAQNNLSEGGMILSIDSGYYDKQYSNSAQNMCANSSIAPFSGTLQILWDKTGYTYSKENLIWTNMGNNHGCKWNTQTVMHELAHGMGMYQHFEPQFGSWSDGAFDVLATLYHNAPGTKWADLQVNTQ